MNNRDLIYLSNPNFIKHFNKQNKKNDNDDMKKDISFYKERISKIYDDLIKGKSINPVVDSCFNNFIEKTIEYLKFTDKRDILQREYDNLPDTSLNPIKIKNKFTLHDTNELMIKKKENIKNMNHYIKKSKQSKRKNIKFPRVKNINIQVEELKYKNIGKK